MGSRSRRALVLLAGVLLVAGLILSGTLHHGAHSTGQAPYCDGCAVTGTEAPSPVAPVARFAPAFLPPIARPDSRPFPVPLVVHSPRGPPDAA